NVDFDDYSDWIELHNAGSQPVSLSGFFLTDDITEPLKWPFPSGGTIPAGGYLVVRADGFDAGPGERHSREFSPWASFTTDNFHTNFKLSGSGEELALVYSDSNVAGGPMPLLSLGARWNYLDNGSDQGAEWIQPDFDDSSWAEGNGQLGYGENDQATTISFGDDSDNKFATTYFRTSFTGADLSVIDSVQLNALVDDGAIIYVNGVETHRVRMPDGPVGYQEYAASDAREDVFDNLVFDKTMLNQGTNTIAVEVHQGSGNSSDVSFVLEILAQTSAVADDYSVVDTVTFDQQWDDVSYGRSAADAAVWSYFGEPTPGAANTTAPASDPNARAADLEFSVAGGFFDRSVSLELALPANAVESAIFYTLDGSWPTSGSTPYNGPIVLDKTTVVRARTFGSDLVPGPLQTHTYFINEPPSVLPVVSFVVDPVVFFDSSLGIYRNVHKGREAPINLAYYEPAGDLGFQVNAGCRIGGENIWRFAQKPLSVTLRGKYGNDAVGYHLFPEQRLATFSKFNFRNGGDNWEKDMLRDALTPDIMRGQMQNEVETYRPVVVYMNGEYWGIHNLRKGLDPAYFATVHHVEPGKLEHLEFGHLTSNNVDLGAKEGTMDGYLALETYARDNDLADPVHWAYMESRMDMESFMDYIIIEDYVNNTSWRHNREFWRNTEEGNKWQWIVPDLDRGLNMTNITTSLLDDMVNDFPLYRELIENPDFLNRLAQRYCAHLGSTFHPDRIADIVNKRDAEVLPEVPRHVARWARNGGMSLNGRRSELNEIKEFARQRAPHIYSDYRQNFDMPDTVPLTVKVSTAGGGRILLNGVPILPEYGESMPVFEGLPCYAIAEPAPGYRFLKWSNGKTTARIDFSISSDTSLTATFFPTGETLLPPVIGVDRTLAADGNYTSNGTVVVPAGVTLTIEKGATLRLLPEADLRIEGALQILGTAEAPVRIEAFREGSPWGAIAFADSAMVSNLSHFIVRSG
ncbi:MAG: CotH kinase family protein, partial [Verrucomicrobia bacterium]|nr:CotH kinase family protein [Verrucomicrobiota bacterium]